jgi:hypothetical protein
MAARRLTEGRGVTPRVRAILNWSPTLILSVSEPFENRIATSTLLPMALFFVSRVSPDTPCRRAEVCFEPAR